MADEMTVRAPESSFAPCPAGSQQGVCVDVINMGDTMESYMDNPPEQKPKVVLVFQTDEENPDTGKRYEPSIEFTASFGSKANLRKFLGAWRGKPYGDAEAKQDGAPLHKLVGVNAILNVQHKESKSNEGRVYAIIASIAPPMKGMAKIVPHNYERSEHWLKRKADYAAKVATAHASQLTPAAAAMAAKGYDDFPAALQDEDDSLPF